MTTARHYYESHVTIEPVFDERLEQAKQLAEIHGFKVADLLMKKRAADSEERSKHDTFMTAHDTDLDDIIYRTKHTAKCLADAGFKVWRYKIEDIVMDSRIDDELEIL